jgi:hypothetical protein
MCPMEKIILRLPIIETIGQFVADHGNRISTSWNRTFGEPTIWLTPTRIVIFLQWRNGDSAVARPNCAHRIPPATCQAPSIPSTCVIRLQLLINISLLAA